MKVAQLIERRQPMWQELENLGRQINRKAGKRDPEAVARFSELYRAACADLALAESYQLPPKTVDYLHRLVARAHNQLYRSRSYRMHVICGLQSIQHFSDTIEHIRPAYSLCWRRTCTGACLGPTNWCRAADGNTVLENTALAITLCGESWPQ